MHKLRINIIDERTTQTETLPSELIEEVLSEAYSSRAQMNGSVNIMVVDDKKIAEMNEAFLNHQGPTDVLAFDDGEIEGNYLLLGDIAVSADTARTVASKKNMSYIEELTLYTLHGLLHLLGMDDKTDELREEMMKAQENEFSKHGLKFIR